MNAGRDVERLIAGWLVDEAADGAPDRVLESARLSIDRTRQRRWIAAWRDPVFVSPLRLAGMVGLVVIALVGGAFIGRATAPPGGVGGQPTPAPSVAPPAGGATIEAYRAARNAICARYATAVNPLKAELDGIFDPETSAQDRSAKAQVLLDIVTQLESMVGELGTLEAPGELAAGHAAYVTRYQDMNLFIRNMLTRISEGDLEGAATVDESINVLNDPMLLFESENLLDHCP